MAELPQMFTPRGVTVCGQARMVRRGRSVWRASRRRYRLRKAPFPWSPGCSFRTERRVFIRRRLSDVRMGPGTWLMVQSTSRESLGWPEPFRCSRTNPRPGAPPLACWRRGREQSLGRRAQRVSYRSFPQWLPPDRALIYRYRCLRPVGAAWSSRTAMNCWSPRDRRPPRCRTPRRVRTREQARPATSARVRYFKPMCSYQERGRSSPTIHWLSVARTGESPYQVEPE